MKNAPTDECCVSQESDGDCDALGDCVLHKVRLHACEAPGDFATPQWLMRGKFRQAGNELA